MRREYILSTPNRFCYNAGYNYIRGYYLIMELIFEVIRKHSGGYTATCLNDHVIDTRAANLEELHDNITAAVDARFIGRPKPDPSAIHLMLFAE